MLVRRLDATAAVTLSGSAPVIWELLDTHRDVDGLTDALMERYEDSRSTIEAGARAAMQSLISKDLVTETTETTETVMEDHE